MKSIKYLCLFLALIALASGCAGTQGSVKLVNPPAAGMNFAQFSSLIVKVAANPETTITSADKDRLQNLIVKQIKTDAPDRFKSINANDPGPNILEAGVVIKRYDEGNAFARVMLAGLGQIHIDANVDLRDWETKNKLATYDVNKTFAWGGMYGGFTDIKSVEDGFAKAVAAAIQGKQE